MNEAIIMNALKEQVEKESAGRITVKYDKNGNPSYMLVVPKFSCETIDSALGCGTHPAFIVDGKEVEQIYIGICGATIVDGCACSLPWKTPRTDIDFDKARASCEEKGKGWHLFNAWEYAAVVSWVTRNKMDLFKKDVWMWLDGMKINNGTFFFPADNAFMTPEKNWPSQGVGFEDVDRKPVLSNAVKNHTEKSDVEYGDFITEELGALKKTKGYEKLSIGTQMMMRRLLIDPSALSVVSAITDSVYVRNYGERLPLRGGNWTNGASAGLGYLHLNYRRSISYGSVGFRPAFIEV